MRRTLYAFYDITSLPVRQRYLLSRMRSIFASCTHALAKLLPSLSVLYPPPSHSSTFYVYIVSLFQRSVSYQGWFIGFYLPYVFTLYSLVFTLFSFIILSFHLIYFNVRQLPLKLSCPSNSAHRKLRF